MNAFEQLVAEILWMDGYWVRTSVKVDLTKKEKVLIGRHSNPRWELDIVAYRGRDNVLRVVECKSYLFSRGVALCAFNGKNAKFAKRFKPFCDANLRKLFSTDCANSSLIQVPAPQMPQSNLAQLRGRIASAAVDREGLHKTFGGKGWDLVG